MGLGRKVFFLYPHSVIQDELILSLIKNEYEVYALHDHVKALKVLKKFPDSLCFINIDEALHEKEWENYVVSIQNDPDLKGVGLGIVSYENNEDLKRKYLMDLMLPCGFIQLKLGVSESENIILRMLEANEAKGRRRYVRIECPSDDSASLNVRLDGALYHGHVYDISSVGFACDFTKETNLQKNNIIDIQLRLRGLIINTSGVVAGVRQDNLSIKVVLFYPKLGTENRDKLYQFIMRSLQKEAESW